MKSGFTLIEIIIVLLITSILSVSLYQMFFQVSRSVRFISKTMELDSPIFPFYNQLELDVTGMFWPIGTVKEYAEKLKKQAADKSEQAKDQAKTPDKAKQDIKQDTAAGQEQEKDKKQEKKVIKNIFYLKASESNKLTMSFLTTGGIQTLESDGSIKQAPYIGRAAYILQSDQTQANTLKLIYRFETDNLDIESILKPNFRPSFELISGIKNFKVQFTVYEFIEKPEDKSQAQAKAEQEKKPEQKPVVLTEWNEEEVFKKYKTLIPAYITFKGTLVDNASTTEYPFEFSFKVPGYSPYIEEKKQEEKTEQQKAPEKKNQDKKSENNSKSAQLFEQLENFFNNKSDRFKLPVS